MYEQQKLDFIRDTLMTSFSRKYFQIYPGREIASTKINWIRSLLLASHRLSAVKVLYEIALLLKYCNAIHALWTEFEDLRDNPINLRSFFFELFIYKTFDDASYRRLKSRLQASRSSKAIVRYAERSFSLNVNCPMSPA